MKTSLSDLTTQQMLTLVRAALHGTAPDENLFVDSGEADWNTLFMLSAAQGVMILSLDGTMLLPKKLQPPLSIKLRWIASVDAKEKQYRHCLETAQELSALFRENNIRMLLFKGVALSRLYPVPGSRQFGDIDIFLCGKSKEGNVILERIANKNKLAAKKHSDFSYKNILIENHHTFLGKKSFLHSESLEKRLIMVLTEAGYMDETSLAESFQTEDTILFPPPDFDALFVTLHTIAHFSSRIVLRQLCDLTVLFTAYKGKIDFHLYRNALSEAGLLKLANVFISLSVRKLGLNPEYAPQYESDLALENRIWNDMIDPKVSPPPNGKRSLFNVFIYKMKLLRSRYWKSELIFQGQYGKKIFLSIWYHLRHPEIIGKVFY